MKKLQDANVKDKKVFLRVDLDVPFEIDRISDSTRLEAWLPTLEYLIGNRAKITVAGHLGRPSGEDRKLSLSLVADWIAQKLNLETQESETSGFRGWKIGGNILILENLRFYKEEEANDQEFAQRLAALAEIYINDAFASSHREHASIVGVPNIIPGYAGLRLQKEVNELSSVMENPVRPLTIIVGGAKIETKLPLISKMHRIAEFVLVGGEIAEHVRQLAKVEHEKTVNKKSELMVAGLTPDNKDIDESSIQSFKEIIEKSKTIVWNGPMGEFEQCFDLGTREIATAVANSRAHTIVGGGDTVSFINKEGLRDKFSFVSTGGGAMLEFLSGEELPGLSALA